MRYRGGPQICLKSKTLPSLTILPRRGVDAGQQATGIRVDTIQLLDDLREGVLDFGLFLDLLLKAGEDDGVDEGRGVGHGDGMGERCCLDAGRLCQRQVLSGQAVVFAHKSYEVQL